MTTIRAAIAAALTILCFSAPAHAAPPLGPANMTTEQKAGVTLYQVSGLKGKIPLKKVWVQYPAGDGGGYWDLQFASANMNTEMQFVAKFVLPDGMVFKAFSVNNVQITTNSADDWDGKTMIDKVTLSPWTLNTVLEQCKQQLDNGDGTFKSSATFNLQSSVLDTVKAKGFYTYPGNDNTMSLSSPAVKPRTRVTAYIVESERKGSGIRPQRAARRSTNPVRAGRRN